VAPVWQRCERCRKIRSSAEFDEGSRFCSECQAAADRPKPAVVRVTRPASGVTAATTPGAHQNARQAARPSPEGPLVALGAPGRGDREVRVRRARIRALEALAEAHPEEFELLLAAERAAERL